MKSRSVERSVHNVLKDAGYYMLLGPPGFELLYRMQYSVADEEWQPRLCVPEGQELLHEIPGQGQVPLGCRQRVLHSVGLLRNSLFWLARENFLSQS